MRSVGCLVGAAALLFGIVAAWSAVTAGGEPAACYVTVSGQRPTVTLQTDSPTDTDDERMEIARRLFSACLETHKASGSPWIRLLDYRIDDVQLYKVPSEARPRVIVVYSVLPMLPSTDHWVAGNGSQDGFWIVRKSALVSLARAGNTYWIMSGGTGG